MPVLKRFVSRLPNRWQTSLKRAHFSRQIRKDAFLTNEPEYKILDKFIAPGDWVIDVGANVGHYTKRFSELVGSTGRVIAFEPVPITFYLLSGNTQRFTYQNVSLINAAVSDKLDEVGISIPKFSSGLTNYYRAHLSSVQEGLLSVLTLSLDSLSILHRIALIKIDAEGHEAFVLAGMRKLIEASHPVLIVETGSDEVIDSLKEMDYIPQRLSGSPNILFRPQV